MATCPCHNSHFLLSTPKVAAGVCSSRAWWPLAPNFCSRATRKSQIFHTNHMLGNLDFTVSEHWAPFNFPWSRALGCCGVVQQCQWISLCRWTYVHIRAVHHPFLKLLLFSWRNLVMSCRLWVFKNNEKLSWIPSHPRKVAVVAHNR